MHALYSYGEKEGKPCAYYVVLHYILLWEIVEQNAFRHTCVWCTCLSVTDLSECEVPLCLLLHGLSF